MLIASLGLRPSFVSPVASILPRSESRFLAQHDTAVRAVVPPYPRGPRSGPGFSVPVHHHLIGPIRPTRRHAPISPPGGLYAAPWLCRRGRPRPSASSSELSRSFLLSMSPSTPPESSPTARTQFFIGGVRLRPSLYGTRHSQRPTLIRFTWNPLSGSPGSLIRYNLLSCLPLWRT